MSGRPPSVDLRELFGPIRDQGTRPTCLAFASSAAHENARARVAPLSPEALFHSCVDRDPPAETEGTTTDVIAAALQEDGQCDEADWPYGAPAPIGAPTFYRAQPGPPRAVHINEFVKAALVQGQPVILALTLTGAWENAGPDGVIPSPTPADEDLGGHAVLAVGYDLARNVTLARNSWSTDWGDRGYAWLPDDYLDAYVFDTLTLLPSP